MLHKRFSSQDVIVPYRGNGQLGAYMQLDASASQALPARVRHVIVPAKTLNKQPGLTAS